jgi:hypothetical protein
MKTDGALTQAYHNATFNYESAKANTGDQMDAFAKSSVMKKILEAR